MSSALSQKALQIIDSAAVVGAAATVNCGARCLGYSRIRGYYFLDPGSVGPAAGFPRVLFGNDGASFLIQRVLALDPNQAPALAYPIDLPIEGRYVVVQYVNGGGVSTVRADVHLLPEE